ncbi:MAG: triose-phosphate isomerase [Pseudomonadota bacterium]|jgi:triosephosphate isomerase
MSSLPVLLIGNWKMNLCPSEAAAFAVSLRERLPVLSRTRVWVTPSALSAAYVKQKLDGSPIEVGAQNVHWASAGAFTGETSPLFAKDLGLTFALVGHSERRTLFGESSEQVAKRMKAALATGLTAVVCIGETEAERAAGRTQAVLKAQLEPIFAELDTSSAPRVVIAYEPVWAIGTGKVASEGEIQQTHDDIRQLWEQQDYGVRCTVVYGGSVTPANFRSIIALPGVDGALVGGASIKLDQWLELIAIADATPA